jgi:hypothetical protein
VHGWSSHPSPPVAVCKQKRQLHGAHFTLAAVAPSQPRSRYVCRSSIAHLAHLEQSTYGDGIQVKGQHTSAYVSIRQHTSAHVSLRQHTSTYVNIRAECVSVAHLSVDGAQHTQVEPAGCLFCATCRPCSLCATCAYRMI